MFIAMAKRVDYPMQGRLIKKGIKLTHLKLISAIAETKKISAAAHKLNMAQPSASRLLAELEYIVEAKLYTRIPRGIVLNEAGIILAKRARHILNGLDITGQELLEIGQGIRGTVNIGAVNGPAIEMIIPLIKYARRELPNIDISVAVNDSNKLAEATLAGDIDFYIGRITKDMDPRPFKSQLIGKEQLSLIVRKDHPLISNESIKLSDCMPFDWLLQSSGKLMRITIEQYFLDHNLELPKNIISTSSNLMTLAIISQTESIAPIAKSVADYIQRKDGLGANIRQLPIAKKLFVSNYSLIWLRDSELTPASAAIHKYLQKQIPNKK